MLSAVVKLPSQQTLQQAHDLLQSDELVAFPTETVYGLGANARSAEAVEKIFEIKGRPTTNPLIVHIPEVDYLDKVTIIQSHKMRLRLEKLVTLWPGPLTVILPKHPSIPQIVTAGRPSVGIRIPDHPLALNLLRLTQLPLAAPSANRANCVSPTTALHVYEELGPKLQLIIDGGKCSCGIESTIISLVSATPTILRPGSICIEQLQETLGEVVNLGVKTIRTEQNTKSVRKFRPAASAPGQSRVHYAPATPVAFENDIDPQFLPARTGLITLGPRPKTDAFIEVRVLSSTSDLAEAAANLFATLRDLDKRSLDLILVEACPLQAQGLAIMDRLRRATAKSYEPPKPRP